MADKKEETSARPSIRISKDIFKLYSGTAQAYADSMGWKKVSNDQFMGLLIQAYKRKDRQEDVPLVHGEMTRIAKSAIPNNDRTVDVEVTNVTTGDWIVRMWEVDKEKPLSVWDDVEVGFQNVGHMRSLVEHLYRSIIKTRQADQEQEPRR